MKSKCRQISRVRKDYAGEGSFPIAKIFFTGVAFLVSFSLSNISHIISDAFAGDLRDGLTASAGLKKKSGSSGGRGVGGAGTVLGGTERERKERRAKRERGYLSTMLTAAKVSSNSKNKNYTLKIPHGDSPFLTLLCLCMLFLHRGGVFFVCFDFHSLSLSLSL
jgi:hypothetical protein